MNCIVTKEEPYGDMERYIRNNGPLPEMLVQRFTRQVANALQYALDQDIVHPNLALNNLLLGADRNIKLCGWSGSVLLNGKNTEANLVFCIAEIAFCMLTSRPAFFKKNVITDPAFKFLKPDLIHKFWDSREPDIRRKRKEFRFSPPFKAFADAIFLNKITTIKGALEEKWLTTGDDLKA